MIVEEFVRFLFVYCCFVCFFDFFESRFGALFG